jgi:hypothetical protein
MSYEFVRVYEVDEEIFDRLYTDSLPYLDPSPETPNYDIFGGIMGADNKRQIWLDSYRSFLENGRVIECRQDGYTVGLWAGDPDSENPAHGIIKFVLIGKDLAGSRSWANSTDFMLATRDFYVNAVCGFTSCTFNTPGPGSSLRWVQHLSTEVTDNLEVEDPNNFEIPHAGVSTTVQKATWKFE